MQSLSNLQVLADGATIVQAEKSLEAKMKSGSEALEARLDLKMQGWAVKIVIAVLVGQAALGPIGMEAFSSLRQALSTLVR